MCAPEISDMSRDASVKFALGGLALVVMPVFAADTEALDEEFLEYLAEFDRDDWSWFDAHQDDPDARKPAPQKPATTSADKEHQP
ncbi:MAG TPA: hypothetical protein VFR96_05170 [Povalibacter sp.]|nr:hypothetical protein [Povalibacter sp.]